MLRASQVSTPGATSGRGRGQSLQVSQAVEKEGGVQTHTGDVAEVREWEEIHATGKWQAPGATPYRPALAVSWEVRWAVELTW